MSTYFNDNYRWSTSHDEALTNATAEHDSSCQRLDCEQDWDPNLQGMHLLNNEDGSIADSKINLPAYRWSDVVSLMGARPGKLKDVLVSSGSSDPVAFNTNCCDAETDILALPVTSTRLPCAIVIVVYAVLLRQGWFCKTHTDGVFARRSAGRSFV